MFAIEKFRVVERKRPVATMKLAHANDNRRIEQRAPIAPRRTALVARWRMNEQTGRLEQHWSVAALPDDPSSSALSKIRIALTAQGA